MLNLNFSNKIVGTTFFSRISSRVISIILNLIIIYLISNNLSIEELSIYFIIMSFFPIAGAISSGINGVNFFLKIHNDQKRTSIIINHLYHLFLSSVFVGFIITFINSYYLYNAEIFIKKSTIFNEIIPLVFILIFSKTNLNIFHNIFQVEKKVYLTGLFTGTLERFLSLIFLIYFYYSFQELNLFFVLLSISLANLLSYIFGLLIVFKQFNFFKNFKNCFSINNFLENINFLQTVNLILNNMKLSSLVWVATFWGNADFIIIFGFFSYFVNIFSTPIFALNFSSRGNVFDLINKSDKSTLSKIISSHSKILSYYFFTITILLFIFFMISNILNISFIEHFSKYNYLIYSLYLFSIFSFLSTFFILFFKQRLIVFMLLKQFKYLIFFNLSELIISVLLLSYFFVFNSINYFFSISFLFFLLLLIRYYFPKKYYNHILDLK